jgi:hypothetical protein
MKKLLFQIGFLLVISLSTYAQELGISNINATGKLKVNGNAGTGGQVLTSNGAAASPTWNTLAAPLTTVGGQFLINFQTLSDENGDFNLDGTSATNTKTLKFNGIEFNTNGDVTINLTTHKITINRSGLYEFEGVLSYSLNGPSLQAPFARFSFVKNLGTSSANSKIIQEEIMPNSSLTGNSKKLNMSFKFKARLLANEPLSLTARMYNIDFTPSLFGMSIGEDSYIFGRFISE